ncbi:radical SAM protein [Adhaeribacter rhizoryzae]|uniref:Radical SAM protein n=1 Tax=Adhaeribacter rhizoryzae TaxID=2607907 RepID=A0A5M6DAP2_9BACT|nr:radical SAM protein [Adhaeribacter rhizoryzae]KAA5543470.1 radical SAM protein [Adhaeribacter rhizoryzae]
MPQPVNQVIAGLNILPEAPSPELPSAIITPINIKPVMLNRWQSFWAMRRIRFSLFWLILIKLRNPLKAVWAIRQLIKIRRRYLGDFAYKKVAKVDNRYFYEYNTPGWPSKAFDDYHLAELNRLVPFEQKPYFFKNVIIAITKKCALRCEHCFEWDALNKKEKLTTHDLQAIVQQFQAQGVGQLQFSGGEPLLRMPTLISLLQTAQPGTDFWVLTSGHLLTPEHAQSLKQAGLTGVTISLDHVDPHQHNLFRGFSSAYDWVEQAAANANKVGLVVGFSLCATKAFVTEQNLMAYARLVSQLGGVFIQVLEPKAVGHYAGQTVGLAAAQQKILEDFYTKLNYYPAYHHLPMVVYYDYQRRRAGCAGAADRHVYVDTDGNLHACPFCQKPAGNMLEKGVENALGKLRQTGCPVV